MQKGGRTEEEIQHEINVVTSERDELSENYSPINNLVRQRQALTKQLNELGNVRTPERYKEESRMAREQSELDNKIHTLKYELSVRYPPASAGHPSGVDLGNRWKMGLQPKIDTLNDKINKLQEELKQANYQNRRSAEEAKSTTLKEIQDEMNILIAEKVRLTQDLQAQDMHSGEDMNSIRDKIQSDINTIDKDIYDLKCKLNKEHDEITFRLDGKVMDEWTLLKWKFIRMVGPPNRRDEIEDLLKRINVIDIKIKEELKLPSVRNLPELEATKQQFETDLTEMMTRPEFLLYLHNNITSQIADIMEVSKYLWDYGLHSCMSVPQSACDWVEHCEARADTRRKNLEEKQKTLIMEWQ